MEVGIRELKAHLSEYIDRACKGEPIVVTDRGKAKVRLEPLQNDLDKLPSGLRRMVMEGKVKYPGPARKYPLPPAMEIELPNGLTTTDLIRWARGHEVPALEEALKALNAEGG